MVGSGWEEEQNGHPRDPQLFIPGIAPGGPPLPMGLGAEGTVLPPNLTAVSLQKQEQKKGTDEILNVKPVFLTPHLHNWKIHNLIPAFLDRESRRFCQQISINREHRDY